MDSDSWTRMSTYSRRYQSRSELTTEVYHGEGYEAEREQRPEFLCPFCSEEFDIVGLCCHFDEEHANEAKNGVCPICLNKVGSGLIHHLTVQHGSLLKVQRSKRFHRGGSNLSLAILRKGMKEAYSKSTRTGSPHLVSSSHKETDSYLTSFICNAPVNDEPFVTKPISSPEVGLIMQDSNEDVAHRLVQSYLMSDESLEETAQRCIFVQGLVLSTFLDEP